MQQERKNMNKSTRTAGGTLCQTSGILGAVCHVHCVRLERESMREHSNAAVKGPKK
jgi:hypothetical protein